MRNTATRDMQARIASIGQYGGRKRTMWSHVSIAGLLWSVIVKTAPVCLAGTTLLVLFQLFNGVTFRTEPLRHSHLIWNKNLQVFVETGESSLFGYHNILYPGVVAKEAE